MFAVVVGGVESVEGLQDLARSIGPRQGKGTWWRTSRSVGDVEAYGGMMRTVADIPSVSAVFTASRFLSLPMVDALMRRCSLLVSKCRSDEWSVWFSHATIPTKEKQKDHRKPCTREHAASTTGTRMGRPRRSAFPE